VGTLSVPTLVLIGEGGERVREPLKIQNMDKFARLYLVIYKTYTD